MLQSLSQLRRFLAPLPLGILTLLAALGIIAVQPASQPSTVAQTADPRSSNFARNVGPRTGRTEVRAMARLIPASGLIALGARPGQRIDSIAVREGDQVEAGTLLATLEGHAAAQAALEVAHADRLRGRFERDQKREALKVARDQFDQSRTSRLAAMKDEAAFHRKNLEKAIQDRARLEASGTTPTSWLTHQDLVVGQLRQIVTQTEAQLAEFEARLAALRGDREREDRALADDSPALVLLDKQEALAQANLEQTLVKAPIAGRILMVLVHPGEIAAGPILYLGDITSMVAEAEVYQADIPAIEVGDPVDVFLLGRNLPGTVERIATFVSPNRLVALDPSALVDRRVVNVRVALKDSSLASRFVNMQVDLAIRPSASQPK